MATLADGGEERIEADTVLVATGAAPRTLPTAQPDGERILTWEQVYDLEERPEHLVVVGSGVTGAEFAGAYNALGIEVTLVSSRDRVLPGEDPDAAEVLEEVFKRRGMTVLGKSRMASVTRDGDRVTVALEDGREVVGSHCLLALGSVPEHRRAWGSRRPASPSTRAASSRSTGSRAPRPRACTPPATAPASSCSPRWPRCRAGSRCGTRLGDAVSPLDLKIVSSNVFTAPEIATVGCSQKAVDEGEIEVEQVMLPLATNARAKMQGVQDGFVKMFCRPGTGHRRRGRRGRAAGQRAHPRAVDRRGRAAHGRRPRAHLHRLPVDERVGGRGGPPAAHRCA